MLSATGGGDAFAGFGMAGGAAGELALRAAMLGSADAFGRASGGAGFGSAATAFGWAGVAGV